MTHIIQETPGHMIDAWWIESLSPPARRALKLPMHPSSRLLVGLNNYRTGSENNDA